MLCSILYSLNWIILFRVLEGSLRASSPENRDRTNASGTIVVTLSKVRVWMQVVVKGASIAFWLQASLVLIDPAWLFYISMKALKDCRRMGRRDRGYWLS